MVLMSHASAFVGTQHSTYSLTAAMRVKKWTGGEVRLVEPVVTIKRS